VLTGNKKASYCYQIPTAAINKALPISISPIAITATTNPAPCEDLALVVVVVVVVVGFSPISLGGLATNY
jgi:hypothetical protein